MSRAMGCEAGWGKEAQDEAKNVLQWQTIVKTAHFVIQGSLHQAEVA